MFEKWDDNPKSKVFCHKGMHEHHVKQVQKKLLIKKDATTVNMFITNSVIIW